MEEKINNSESAFYDPPKGYTYLGWFSEDASEFLEAKYLPILIKDEFLQELKNGEVGKFVRINDFDAFCLGLDEILGLAAEYPYQIRDGGGGISYLCIRPVEGYVDYGKVVKDYCYMLRIVPAQSEDGEEFWECIEVETNYNLYRNDAVLWDCKMK